MWTRSSVHLSSRANKKATLMFCLPDINSKGSRKQSGELWPYPDFPKVTSTECFENAFYGQVHMGSTVLISLSTAGLLRAFVLPCTLWLSIGRGSHFRVVFQYALSHIKMFFGPGAFPYQGIKSPVSTGLPTLCENTFPYFRINTCSFALFKGMCQWPSCIPPAFSISDSTESERQSA